MKSNSTYYYSKKLFRFIQTSFVLGLLLLSLITYAQKAKSPKVILSDPLKKSTIGKIRGGEFVKKGGWAANKDSAMILWEIPDFGPNGMLEFDVRNFDPPKQVTNPKNNFIGLWGMAFANHEGAKLSGTDGIELRIGTTEKQFKVEYHAMGIGKVRHWEPVTDAVFDPKHTYHFKIVWMNGVVTVSIDNLEPLVFPGIPEDPIDHFNYLHLGTSPHFGAKCTVGPIYSNIKISEL